MPLPSLSAKTDFAYPSPFHSRGRRPSHDNLGASEATDAVKPVEPTAEAASFPNSFDTAYYASRFKADLFELRLVAEEQDNFDRPSPTHTGDAESDKNLFDFFGNLSVLLVSVRAGDLEKARAAADALEMELMVERSAAPRPDEAGQPNRLDDLMNLWSAAKSGDERAVYAAAEDLARDMRGARDAAYESQQAEEAPPADGAAAVYDTLIAYGDGEAPSVA
jgi:hypothetical protein